MYRRVSLYHLPEPIRKTMPSEGWKCFIVVPLISAQGLFLSRLQTIRRSLVGISSHTHRERGRDVLLYSIMCLKCASGVVVGEHIKYR